MTNDERQARLRAELEALKSLKSQSTFFDFISENDPPNRYTIEFRGVGYVRNNAQPPELERIELHRVELRLSYGFPDRGPDIRWLTPIFHPNVSYSGLVSLPDLGMIWRPDIGLDQVCERLWDVARLAYMDPEKATNYAARSFWQQQTEIKLPADQRALRDGALSAAAMANVIRYERRPGGTLNLPAAQAMGEVLYIGEETPTPELPRRQPYRPAPRPAPNSPGDDDVLYIE